MIYPKWCSIIQRKKDVERKMLDTLKIQEEIMFKIQTKVLSSLEKCFIDENVNSKKETTYFKVLKGQSLSFQLACMREDEKEDLSFTAPYIDGELAEFVTAKEVIYVPSTYPVPVFGSDEYYLRKDIGFYPDPIRPLHYNGCLALRPKRLHCVWFDVVIPPTFKSGKYTLTVALKEGTDGKVITEKKKIKIELVDMILPKLELIHTEWFYSDCVAEAHKVKVFSEEHFELLEKYIRTAVKNGINMILTPLFTPELDTYIGGERLTTQLVKIKVTGKDSYEFNFDLLGRWVKMCLEAGVEYFEIPHFYTQWGAAHAPKFVAEVDGEEKRIFGWETNAIGGEYKEFLAQLIPATIEYMKSLGVDKKCFFHISDEPGKEHLKHYIACKEQIAPYLEGYNIIDALSSFDFYKSGALKKPVPHLAHIDSFVEHKIEGLWAYYCGLCGGENGTGRAHGMPPARTRILGVILYHLGVEGFLHWGYNFYNNIYSYDRINPFAETAGEYFAPSGDAFLVYPGEDGPLESQRLVSMREAMEDHRLLKLYESKHGRENTLKMLKDVVGYELTVSKYPRDNDFFSKLYDTVIEGMK